MCPAGDQGPCLRRSPPGRPLDQEITRRVLKEAQRQLCDRGYQGLSVEKVARQVHVAKASIYRRWPSKADLVADLVTRFTHITDIPDTGDLMADLLAYKRVHLEGDPSLFTTDSERAIRAEAMLHPEVVPLIRDRILGQRRRIGRAILLRAIARGEVNGDTDVELVLDLLSGLMVFRRAFRVVPIEPHHLEDSIQIILTGIQGRRP
jgi:AcrR family transcriptional regulator